MNQAIIYPFKNSWQVAIGSLEPTVGNMIITGPFRIAGLKN